MAWDPAPSRASRGASDRAQVEATTYLLFPQPVPRVALAPTVPMCVRVGKGRPVILCQGLVSVLLGRLESIVNMVSVCRGLGTCTVHQVTEQAVEVSPSRGVCVCPFPRDTVTLTATVNSPEALPEKLCPHHMPALMANRSSSCQLRPHPHRTLETWFIPWPVHVSVASGTSS